MDKKSTSSCWSYRTAALCIVFQYFLTFIICTPLYTYLIVNVDDFESNILILYTRVFQNDDYRIKEMLDLYLRPILSAILTTLVVDLIIAVLTLVGILKEKPALLFPFLFIHCIGLFIYAIFITALYVITDSLLLLLIFCFSFAIECLIQFIMYKCYKQIKYGKITKEETELIIVR